MIYSQEHTSHFQTEGFFLVSHTNIIHTQWDCIFDPISSFLLYKFSKSYAEHIGYSVISTESLSLYSNFTHAVLLVKCGQPSYRGIEPIFQSQSVVKKFGFLCTHGTGD
jgi:hypothetical protein